MRVLHNWIFMNISMHFSAKINLVYSAFIMFKMLKIWSEHIVSAKNKRTARTKYFPMNEGVMWMLCVFNILHA